MSRSKIEELGRDELQRLLDESSSYAEVLRKIKMCQHGHNQRTLKKVIDKFGLDLTKINKAREELTGLVSERIGKEIPLEDIISGKHKKEYQGSKLKNRLIKAGYKEYRCERCGLTEWLGQPIPLQLHHKDGNHCNNELSNLELLCPNCHSLTDNYAGKNVKHREKSNKNKNKNENNKDICPICNNNLKSKNAKMCRECFLDQVGIDISREVLKDQIRKYPFTQIGLMYKVSDNAIRKWCEKLGLPSKSREIKKISDEDWINI